MNVFKWKNHVEWSTTLLDIVSDVVDADVIDHFRRWPPENYGACDLSWLDEIIKLVKKTGQSDIKHTVAHRFQQHYSALRGHHACCPTDVSSYYEYGLLPLDPARMQQSVRHHLLESGEFPELTEEMLQDAISKVRTKRRENRIYFGLDDRFLVNWCGHYLLYGSEYRVGIATELSLSTGKDYRAFFKGIGKPTIFKCDLPLAVVPDWAIDNLTGDLVESVFRDLLEPGYTDREIDFGFEVAVAIPPDCIAGHYHPEGVRDPLARSVGGAEM